MVRVRCKTKCSLNTLIQMHMQGLKSSQLRGNGKVAKSYLANKVRTAAIVSFLVSGHNTPTLNQLI